MAAKTFILHRAVWEFEALAYRLQKCARTECELIRCDREVSHEAINALTSAESVILIQRYDDNAGKVFGVDGAYSTQIFRLFQERKPPALKRCT
jgi:hypothetical protein